MSCWGEPGYGLLLFTLSIKVCASGAMSAFKNEMSHYLPKRDYTPSEADV